MSVRNAQPGDAETCAAWLKEAEHINLLDRGVYSYPTTQTLVVEHKGEPQLINSFQAVLVMEALAPRPGLTPLREAWALNQLFERIKEISRSVGVKEVMFGCKDEGLEKFIKARGFEKLSFPVFRFKL